ncbi:MAG TPA: hypothetical protein VIW19_04970 [Gaiellaceae bacterium]|jgi:hypothetical protein
MSALRSGPTTEKIVVLAATARCFFAKTTDALGVLPDAHYAKLDPELREALVVGRPISDT